MNGFTDAVAAMQQDGHNAGADDVLDPASNDEPMFIAQHVEFRFGVSTEFVAAQVANNMLVLALATGRILRIDLDNPADIDGRIIAQASRKEREMSAWRSFALQAAR